MFSRNFSRARFQRFMSQAILKNPRILFLNRSYWPDSEATGQLLTALCEGLADQFEIHVLAGQPNADGGQNWQDVHRRNGVTIHRVAHTTFSKNRLALKFVNFLSFIHAARKRAQDIPAADIVVFETDPFLLPFLAQRLQRKTNCRMVGYLQDIYPDVAVALQKVRNNWAVRRLRTALFGIYRKCDRMIVLSRDMQQLLHDGGITAEQTAIIPNWADTSAIQPVDSENEFRRRYRLDGKFVVMYSGNLGLTQRLEEFVEAAGLLRDEQQIQFVLIGRGARKQELQRQVAALGLDNVLFLDYQPLHELSQSLCAADLHLVPLNRDLARCLMPSKVYGILAAGRPFLTNAPPGTEMYDLARSGRVGLTVPPGSPQEIALAVRKAREDREGLRQMGVNARGLAEERFTRDHAVSAFGRLLHEVVAGRHSGGASA